jgi:uncharacterized membrane protein YkvA (DUF1232 family)
MPEHISILQRLKRDAKRLKNEVAALSLACGDPKTPWQARAVVVCVVAYALSPIDLIPDFIPILGYLDDLILLPLGIVLALCLIPADVMERCRAEIVANPASTKSPNYTAGAVIVVIWLVFAFFAGCYLWLTLRHIQ